MDPLEQEYQKLAHTIADDQVNLTNLFHSSQSQDTLLAFLQHQIRMINHAKLCLQKEAQTGSPQPCDVQLCSEYRQFLRHLPCQCDNRCPRIPDTSCFTLSLCIDHLIKCAGRGSVNCIFCGKREVSGIHQQQSQRLLDLRHAMSCELGVCAYPRCGDMKTLLNHQQNFCTQGESCTTPWCVETRSVKAHFDSCNDDECIVCSPVKMVMQSDDQAAAAALQLQSLKKKSPPSLRKPEKPVGRPRSSTHIPPPVAVANRTRATSMPVPVNHQLMPPNVMERSDSGSSLHEMQAAQAQMAAMQHMMAIAQWGMAPGFVPHGMPVAPGAAGAPGAGDRAQMQMYAAAWQQHVMAMTAQQQQQPQQPQQPPPDIHVSSPKRNRSKANSTPVTFYHANH